ncbi:hypothetical protein Droror1_Dr00024388 [Drosera rotundifolia]
MDWDWGTPDLGSVRWRRLAAGRRQLGGDTRDFASGLVWPSSAGIGLAELRTTAAAVPDGDGARRRAGSGGWRWSEEMRRGGGGSRN